MGYHSEVPLPLRVYSEVRTFGRNKSLTISHLDNTQPAAADQKECYREKAGTHIIRDYLLEG